MEDPSTTSNDPVVRRKSEIAQNLFSALKANGVKTSFDLEGILQEQIGQRDSLLKKKENVEAQVKEMSEVKLNNIQDQVDQLHKRFNSLKLQLNKFKREKLPSSFEQPQLYENVEKVDQLSQGKSYLTVLNFIKSTSEEIETNLETGLETEAIELFHRLKLINQLYMNETNCNHLKEYCAKITAYWEARLLEKLIGDFEKLLEGFGWPMSILTANPTLEMHEKFHKTIRNLFRVCSSVKTKDKSSPLLESTVFTEEDPVLPIEVMMKPLKRRFKFHFFNNKVTGDATKPEWYFCQIKKWMRELTPFIRTRLEPVSVQEAKVSSVVEFVRSLTEMLLVKVDSQLSSEEGVDDEIFGKILEESIIYETEMKEFIYEDMQKCPTGILLFVSTIYSQPSILQRWLTIEKRACLEKLDEMFSSPTAWNRASAPGPPEIVDLFLAVIRFPVERFSYLQQPGHRLQFVHLIMELLEEFRVRCLQTWQSKCEHEYDDPSSVIIDYIIADAVNRVKEVLEDWQDLPFFCELTYFLQNMQAEEKKMNEALLKSEHETQSNYLTELSKRALGFENREQEFELFGDISSGLFGSAIKLYKCLIDEIQSKWLLNTMEMIDLCLTSYSKLKWQALELEDEQNGKKEVAEYDPSITKVIQIVSTLRVALNSGMDPKLATQWIKRIAGEMDAHIFDIVINPNRFSVDAVKKLQMDLVEGILQHFALIQIYPRVFFPCVSSTMKLLGMSKGDAMLLYETLKDGDNASQESALTELQIEIRRELVIRLLQSRTDLMIK